MFSRKTKTFWGWHDEVAVLQVKKLPEKVWRYAPTKRNQEKTDRIIDIIDIIVIMNIMDIIDIMVLIFFALNR